MCDLLCSLVLSHLLFVWTFSSHRGSIREGDAQRREESNRIDHKDLCAREGTGATPSDDDEHTPSLHDDAKATYLTTKDMSDPHFVIVDHIGQMISRELVRLEQYRIGR